MFSGRKLGSIHEEEEIMKLMRLVTCVAAFAVLGGIAFSGEMDIKALQAKLAAQEARLNDLQAKMGSSKAAETPANITSMRKNAKVTIGGEVDTRYIYHSGKVEQDRGYINTSTATARGVAAGRTKRVDIEDAQMYLDTAKLTFQIDVNEHMDARLQLDLHDPTSGGGNREHELGIAQTYWVRWKNICNSGFGVLFGMGKPIGMLDAYNQDGGPNSAFGSFAYPGSGTDIGDSNTFDRTDGLFATNGVLSQHLSYGTSRTTQITPYWQSEDGKVLFELSFMQGLDRRGTYNTDEGPNTAGGYNRVRSINMGLATMSGRITWKPTEDWTLVLGAINLQSDDDNFGAYRGQDTGNAIAGRLHPDRFNGNNFAYHLGAMYTPSILCQRLTVWANMTHEFNAGWVDDLTTFATNFGVMYKLTDKLTVFAQGDYITSDNDGSILWNEAKGWRSYLGATYNLGNGAIMEAGWSHDNLSAYDQAGYKHSKFVGDTLYAKVGFAF